MISTTMSLTTSKSMGPITWDDATWILTSSFIIFTMQSGFGLLESGCVSRKNEVNIMFKNAVDVVFGGLTYWAFGFGLSFGNKAGSNPFCGIGYFFVDTAAEEMGILFSTYVFQLSFATTATTIVSGAMAERTKLLSYIVFSFLNTICYCIPAHWEWASNGFLRSLGVVDIAGSGAVHVVGGVSALVAAFILKPRKGRFYDGLKAGENPLPMGNPANTLIGMFMLWWGWLAFNCGSTFGISGGKWKLAAKAAITTLNSSMGGGMVGIFASYILLKRKFDVAFLVNSILGALVGITAGCAVVRPWEAVVIGIIGGTLAVGSAHLLSRIKVDDPVGAVAVHGVCGIWGMLSVGLFAATDTIENTTQGRSGVFHGGGFYLLGVQLLAAVVITVWSGVVSAILLLGIKFTIGLRMTEAEERLGADYVEHGVGEEDDLPFYERGLFSPPRHRPLSSHTIHSMKSNASINTIADSINDNVNLVKRQRPKAKRFDRVVPIEVMPGEVHETDISRNVENGSNRINGCTPIGMTGTT
ncbi:AMT3-like protein [Mya arenaria]|uniref:Ammonium transporter n=1 Tax=Mya arenaria TaxID=6604 RepID=A0ABY7DVY8_MYAAR|nr:putative ammonium transporter 3 [Mya arenaria]WAR00244.1 AMT3-like protein [Mya arenaria]